MTMFAIIFLSSILAAAADTRCEEDATCMMAEDPPQPGASSSCRCVSTCNTVKELRDCKPAGKDLHYMWNVTSSSGGGKDGCSKWVPGNERNVCSYATSWVACKCAASSAAFLLDGNTLSSATTCESAGGVVRGCGRCTSGSFVVNGGIAWCDGGWQPARSARL
eukprot:TRINITY_DN37703_c0_g1_i1.p1 TRINITY_DN37703_c0_g1~~TRINITY_DN37703_c0_g1_i1.p1  ORF type:complete len:164 (+),score=12.25 TRINITY_DN37703_c0_g1_i1:71-562(+)